VIHVDIDAAEIDKNVPTDVGIVGNVKDVLQELAHRVASNSHKDWLGTINDWREDTRSRDVLNQELPDEMLLAPHVIRAIWEATKGECTIATDVGQHQMWETQYFQHTRHNQLITSGGLGTMGFALPASIGAKLGRPDDEVWAVAGDGGFQMSIPELATLVQEKLNIKIAIVNNHFLGMVRQWQDLMHNKRYSQTQMWTPDFRKLAEAYGILGLRATTQTEMRQVIEQARAHDGPALCEFVVEPEMNVFPMVMPGKALDDMARRQPAALGTGMDGVK
jgi:acetolactate synthase-1/2/3 large subunit